MEAVKERGAELQESRSKQRSYWLPDNEHVRRPRNLPLFRQLTLILRRRHLEHARPQGTPAMIVPLQVTLSKGADRLK